MTKPFTQAELVRAKAIMQTGKLIPNIKRIRRLIGIIPEPTTEEVKCGCVCAICWRPIADEETSGPTACVDCGGMSEIDEYATEEIVVEHSQFGAGV